MTSRTHSGSAIAVILAVVVVAGGCGRQKTAGESTDTRKVAVTISDAGCTASPSTVKSGLVTFKASNRSSNGVDEVELIQGTKILGEREGLTAGKSGDFTLRLDAGSYTLFCPGATTNRTPFTVSGPASSAAPLDSEAGAAYKRYVESEVRKLQAAAAIFTNAVERGELAAARVSYAPARYHYETIEPVAESFGDLDPKIDARIDDVAEGATWTGFHRIEKALWTDKSLAGMTPIAVQLSKDINDLAARVTGETFTAGEIANGCVELLQEVATSKITGEEDRYSHTDLSDFEANVLGSEEGFKTVQVALEAKDDKLAQQIQVAFKAVTDALAPYKRNGEYVDYATVTESQRRELTQKIDALAEPLSHVAALVA